MFTSSHHAKALMARTIATILSLALVACSTQDLAALNRALDEIRAEQDRAECKRLQQSDPRTVCPGDATPQQPATPEQADSVAPFQQPTQRARTEPVTATKVVEVEDSHCGPEWLQKWLPRWARMPIHYFLDGALLPSCKAHDACYSARERPQGECDRDFLRDMQQRCARSYRGEFFGIAESLCHFKAIAFYNLVASSLGGMSYGGGTPAGDIVSHRDTIIYDTFSDDELTACVVIRNPTDRTLEYDVQMFAASGRLIDTEPDTYEVNIADGQQHEFCLGTNLSPQVSYNDIGPKYYIVVRVDDPDTLRFWNDWIVVAHAEYTRPAKR